MTKKQIPKLNIEAVHDCSNLMYLSLLEYKRETYLCLIDSIGHSEVGAYVLDYADQENIPIKEFLTIATRWFYGKSHLNSLSIELSNVGLSGHLASIYRTFDTSYVSRIVGHAPTPTLDLKSKVKRRRIVPIQEGIQVRFKK